MPVPPGVENIATPFISQSTFLLLPDEVHFCYVSRFPCSFHEICLSVKSEDPILNHGIINPFMLIVVLRV